MNDYEVTFKLTGYFPDEFKPQIAKNIKIVKEIEENKSKFTIVSVLTSDESEVFAFENSKRIMREFLGFYSFTTSNHIALDLLSPPIVMKLTGEHRTVLFDEEWQIHNIDANFFLKEILPYWTVISKPENSYFKSAIECFHRTFSWSDRGLEILDCITSLESLFSTKDEKTEIGYRLANRVSTLLGKDKNHRLKLRKMIKDFYNQRSRIVHGDHIDITPHTSELILATRESLARILVLATKYDSQKTIIEKIDDASIDNSLIPDLQNSSQKLIDDINSISKSSANKKKQ